MSSQNSEYVKVIELMEFRGGSAGYSTNPTAFKEAFKGGLTEILPTDDQAFFALTKLMNSSSSTPDGSDLFLEALQGIESLGGSAGYKAHLQNNLTVFNEASVTQITSVEPIGIMAKDANGYNDNMDAYMDGIALFFYHWVWVQGTKGNTNYKCSTKGWGLAAFINVESWGTLHYNSLADLSGSCKVKYTQVGPVCGADFFRNGSEFAMFISGGVAVGVSVSSETDGTWTQSN